MPAPVPDMPTMQELAAPQELQAIAEPTGITLTWLPVRDALRYEVRINGGAWQNNGVQMQFVHEDAPGGSITDATIDASDMTERPHVTLEASDLITEAGPEQTYEVRAIHPDGASPPSEPTTARRPFEVDTVTWERQNIGDETWHPLPDTTIGLTTLDDTAAPEGTTHTYRAIITPIAGAPFTSPTDTGARLAAIQVSVGSLHACALLNNGEVRCWGDNGLGQLGTGDTTQLPQDAANYRIPTAKLPAKAVDISAGVTSTCVLADNSNLYCWGSFDNNLLPYDESTGQKQIAPLNPSDTLVKSIPDNHHQHICYGTGKDYYRASLNFFYTI